MRRLAAAMTAAVWLWPQLSAALPWLMRQHAEVCECLPDRCLCPHPHHAPARPACHYPGGRQPQEGPGFASCHSEKPLAPALPYLPSPVASILVPKGPNTPAVVRQAVAVSPEESPPTPPPR